jgi:hypothetical protein
MAWTTDDLQPSSGVPALRVRLRWYHWMSGGCGLLVLVLVAIVFPGGRPTIGHGGPSLPAKTSAITSSPMADWYTQHGIDKSVTDALRNCPGNPRPAANAQMASQRLRPCLKYVLKVTVHNGLATVETPYGNGMTITTAYHGKGVASYNPPTLQDADAMFAVVVRARADAKDAEWGEWTVPDNPYTGYLDGVSYEVYLCLYDEYSAKDPATYPNDTSVPWDWEQVMPLVLRQATNI